MRVLLSIALVQESTNVLQAHFGRYRDFGLYTDSLGLYGSRMFYYVWDLPIFCMMGAIGGALGGLFIHLNVKVTKLRHRYIPVRWGPTSAFSRGYTSLG